MLQDMLADVRFDSDFRRNRPISSCAVQGNASRARSARSSSPAQPCRSAATRKSTARASRRRTSTRWSAARCEPTTCSPTDGARSARSTLPGDVFGFELESEHTLSAEAIVDSRVVLIRRSAIAALAARDGDVARQLWTLTARELRRVQNHMMLLVKTARERVVSFLLEMAERGPTGEPLTLPMSRQDIADYLGLTIETVSRTLTSLESVAAIALPNSRRIVLRDRAALSRLGSCTDDSTTENRHAHDSRSQRRTPRSSRPVVAQLEGRAMPPCASSHAVAPRPRALRRTSAFRPPSCARLPGDGPIRPACSSRRMTAVGL